MRFPEILAAGSRMSIADYLRIKGWIVSNKERHKEYYSAKNAWVWKGNPKPLLDYFSKYGVTPQSGHKQNELLDAAVRILNGQPAFTEEQLEVRRANAKQQVQYHRARHRGKLSHRKDLRKPIDESRWECFTPRFAPLGTVTVDKTSSSELLQ